MKKFQILLLSALVGLTACNQTGTPPVDPVAEKNAISSVIDLFDAATETDVLASFLSDEALITGSAPAELWNKQQIVDIWKGYFSGMVPEHHFIGERTIALAANGTSATVIEEFNMPAMSSVLAVRNSLHLSKNDGKWMIDFVDISFIPRNEDLPAIEEALKQ